MLRRSHSSIQSFDIQLFGNSGRDSNIVLLSGAPLEASASPLTGQLVLTTLDVSTIKKITIKLVGNLKLRWADSSSSRSAGIPPERFTRQLYSQEYSGFDIPGKMVSSNPASHKATPVGSLSNLTSYFSSGHKHKSSSSSLSRESSPTSSRSASSANLASLAAHGHNGSLTSVASAGALGGAAAHQLPPGTYRFPFELMIPGDLNESIEGNKNSQVSYWLHAVIERNSWQHQLTAKKHVRIVRTVGVDSYDIAHTVSIENTWPNKIEYKITVPCKAVPIGSQLEVQFVMFPLDKGLRLGRIRAEIVEYVTISSPTSPTREEQHVVAQQFFETPPNFDHMADQWEMIKLVDVPRSLSRCTQDATVQPWTKINHKFRCFISLINADGHTSELRASLPITLYISPNIYVVSNNEGAVSSSKTKNTSAQPEQPIFNVQRQPRSGQVTPSGMCGIDDGAAPPTYSHHVYDRLFSTVVTPAESPQHSGTTTPRPGSPGSPSQASLNNLDANQQAQLLAGLRALALSRQNSAQRMPQLSRNNSSSYDLTTLSRVPSYDQAMSERASEEAAPEYPE